MYFVTVATPPAVYNYSPLAWLPATLAAESLGLIVGLGLKLIDKLECWATAAAQLIKLTRGSAQTQRK